MNNPFLQRASNRLVARGHCGGQHRASEGVTTDGELQAELQRIFDAAGENPLPPPERPTRPAEPSILEQFRLARAKKAAVWTLFGAIKRAPAPQNAPPRMKSLHPAAEFESFGGSNFHFSGERI